MTANNIKPVHCNPITGMTIGEVAHWKRWEQTPEAKKEIAEFQAQWDSLPEPLGWKRDSLELQYLSDRLREIGDRMSQSDNELRELGIDI